MQNSIIRSTLLLASCVFVLAACINLPQEAKQTAKHYQLLPAHTDQCRAKPTSHIKLAITKVAPGLNHDRIIQSSQHSGEILYLSDIRWPSETQTMLEQRLASDLESAGFSVISSHHQSASMARLNCELRQLNLIEKNNSRRAKFSLSCHLQPAASSDSYMFTSQGSAATASLKNEAIIKSLSTAYQQGYKQLCTAINHHLTP